MEMFVSNSNNFRVQVFQKEVDNYSLSQIMGISFRGIYQGKMGYAYTEIADEESIKFLIENAKGNAEIIGSTDDIPIYEGCPSYPEVVTYNEDFNSISLEEKMQFTYDLEAEALKLDPRVKTVNYAMYSDGDGEIYLANTKGLELSYSSNVAFCYVSVVVEEGDTIKTGGRFAVGNSWDKFNAQALAKAAVAEAISLLDADSIDSKKYPILLRYDVAASILGTFSSVFSAESVQKGLSLLDGKLGQKIAANTVTLLDDPLLENGIDSKPFDAEGVASKTKAVISNGVLNTFLHNLKTAKKAGVESTGNASKGVKSSVGISPTNFFFEAGDKSYDQLLEEMDEGLVIISVQGLHSGANPVSGDFSLGAYGYYVKDGQIVRAVDQITIAGNFFELLEEIIAVGNDLEFDSSGVGSPSLLVRELAVAGKQLLYDNFQVGKAMLGSDDYVASHRGYVRQLQV